MAINSMALRRKKHNDMRPQLMVSKEMNKSSMMSEKSMPMMDMNKKMGMRSSIGMPACHRVKP